jgi:hypothetical protein
MTLAMICEPILTEVCAVNRAVFEGNTEIGFVATRTRFIALLREAQATADEVGLTPAFRRIRPAVIGFIDWMMSQYDVPLSARWRTDRMGDAEVPRVGQAQFFDLLKADLDNPAPDAEESLQVFYMCLALGYEGIMATDPDGLATIIAELTARLRRRLQVDEKLCPEAYQYTDRRELHLSTGRPLLMIGVGFAFLLAVVFAFSGALYLERAGELKQSLATSRPAPASAAPSSAGDPAAPAGDPAAPAGDPAGPAGPPPASTNP